MARKTGACIRIGFPQRTVLIMLGFRSAAPNSSAQAQDAFGAFMTSNSSSPIPAQNSPMPDGLALQLPHLAEQHGRRFSPGPFQSAPQIPTPAAYIPQHQSSALPRASDWAQDFAMFSQGNASAGNHAPAYSGMQHQPYRPAGFAPNMAFSTGPSFFGSMGGPATASQQGTMNAATAQADFDQEMDRWMAAHGDGKIEDVDAIMEELARQLEQEQAGVQEPQDQQNVETSASTAEASLENSLAAEQSARQNSREASLAQNVGIVDDHGSVIDARLEPNHLPDMSRLDINETLESTSAEPTSQRPSEISEAARQILDSVQHEQGDKWKNSRFLLLMRDFRDGNKDIVDNEIMETRNEGDRQSEQITAAGN
ncbi:hypothetical protein CkaCkLH20_06436 [Colletotrichum karsti]|uniref:Peroxin 20 n=1 Tax=Colletotrichum karsti TaxID=1095194 RepID=A0A9P6I552_9PEZI|nr:uncharacterized protein CkaCkLH20_06436 [Colletotrichum karsti]KAF9875990.1 hypothetical protein CkaCkLH20_06436 [Colletotrichum karsti]